MLLMQLTFGQAMQAVRIPMVLLDNDTTGRHAAGHTSCVAGPHTPEDHCGSVELCNSGKPHWLITLIRLRRFRPMCEIEWMERSGKMLFGPGAKVQAACANPSEVENELQLVEELRLKTGPHADPGRLLHHVRGARGKLHWAGENPSMRFCGFMR